MIKTFFDFCSGVGAGRLGLEKCGLTCVGHSDTSRLADVSYRLLHQTDDKNYGNLKKLGQENLPDFDLLIAGFPCQTFSVIGRKAGFDDSRGQIIFHLSRILREKRPKCFILENVKGLVRHDNGQTIKKIIEELEESGYSTIYKVITSLNCGVPQMRQRVYFIGIRKDIVNNIDDFVWPEEIDKPDLQNYLIDRVKITEENFEILKKYLVNSTNCGKYTIDDLCNMNGKVLDCRMNDLRIYDGKVPTLRAQRDGIYYVYDNTIYQLTGYEALLLQGFPQKYADRVKDIVSDRHLLMQAGNAMTVNVIELLGNCIINYLKTKGEEAMSTWEKFEEDCTKFLNEQFGEYASFIRQGGSDSTVLDIKVETKKNKQFYIEAKHSPAQCGQFVLLPNIEACKFEYSRLNSTEVNEFSEKIINYMNDNFEEFKEAGTSGKNIDFEDCERVFSNWIVKTYKEKGVKFFITNNDIILSIEDFSEYFKVSAKYRIKRSGSSSVGRGNIDKVTEYLESTFSNIEISTTSDKVFVVSNEDLHNKRFVIGKNEFMISKREDNFEIRKLSNTFNANVIFSIELKGNKAGISIEDFIFILVD